MEGRNQSVDVNQFNRLLPSGLQPSSWSIIWSKNPVLTHVIRTGLNEVPLFGLYLGRPVFECPLLILWDSAYWRRVKPLTRQASTWCFFERGGV